MEQISAPDPAAINEIRSALALARRDEQAEIEQTRADLERLAHRIRTAEQKRQQWLEERERETASRFAPRARGTGRA